MIPLLETFADQLSQQADNLAIIMDGSEPEAIAKARRLIHAKLDEPISLAQFNRSFSKIVGCSPRKFREAELSKAKISAQ